MTPYIERRKVINFWFATVDVTVRRHRLRFSRSTHWSNLLDRWPSVSVRLAAPLFRLNLVPSSQWLAQTVGSDSLESNVRPAGNRDRYVHVYRGGMASIYTPALIRGVVTVAFYLLTYSGFKSVLFDRAYQWLLYSAPGRWKKNYILHCIVSRIRGTEAENLFKKLQVFKLV